jgi:hypothetical protein
MLHFSWRRLVWPCILAAVPGSLDAVDGVVLIDQSHALAGNITPGDAPGFPVTITQSGSYRLSGNLIVPGVNTTAIQITADFVTLDLNGFSIIGPTVCTRNNPTTCSTLGSGIGVQAGVENGPAGPRGVRVFNGTVRGMGDHGIELLGDGSAVEKITADGNAGAGIVLNGSVIDSTATLNGQSGISAIIVRGCTATANGRTGIGISSGVATGNSSTFNGGEGFQIFAGTATGNTANQNKGIGIDAACPSSIVANTAVANEKGSIIPSDPSCTLANNATRP